VGDYPLWSLLLTLIKLAISAPRFPANRSISAVSSCFAASLGCGLQHVGSKTDRHQDKVCSLQPVTHVQSKNLPRMMQQTKISLGSLFTFCDKTSDPMPTRYDTELLRGGVSVSFVVVSHNSLRLLNKIANPVLMFLLPAAQPSQLRKNDW